MKIAKKIRYTIDYTKLGYPVHWVNQAGHHTVENLNCADSGEACKKFEIAHPGAVYITCANFEILLGRLAADRARVAAWNQAAQR